MIIYLYGKDTYRRGEKAKAIIEEYKKKHSAFTVQNFDLSEAERRAAFKDTLTAQSLFDPFVFAVASNPFPALTNLGKEFVPALESALDRKETIILFIADEEPPADFSFLAKKPVIVQEFAPLSGRDFENFLFLEAKKMGLTVHIKIITQLAAAFPGDSWSAISELKKIVLKGGELRLNESGKMDFFQSILGLRRSGNMKFSLPLLERLLAREEHAAIFNVLASLVPPEEKKKFADYDIQIKTGISEYEFALLDYVLK
jgi:DNA polymerase III delta subunit